MQPICHNPVFMSPDGSSAHTSKTTARGELKTTVLNLVIERLDQDVAFIKQAGLDLMTFLVLQRLDPKY